MFIFGPKKPNFIKYRLENRDLKFKVAFYKGEIWLTQKQFAQIFDLTVATINEHLKKIFKNEDLSEKDLVRQFTITAKDGKKYLVKHYHYRIFEILKERVRSL